MNFHVENELEVENIMKLESRMELKLYRELENEFDEGQLYDWWMWEKVYRYCRCGKEEIEDDKQRKASTEREVPVLIFTVE